jgi:zinc protease
VRSSDATLALQLSMALYLGRTMSFDDEVEKKIATLTPDAVNAALRKTLDPGKMTVVMTGDFAKVKQAGTPR